MVLPSRATSAKTVQQKKGRGTEQEKSVQRERERKKEINKYNFTLYMLQRKKEKIAWSYGIIPSASQYFFESNLMKMLRV